MENNNENSGVAYENDSWQKTSSLTAKPASLITGGIIKYSKGLIKDERQAGYFMIGVIIVSISLSVFLFVNNAKKTTEFTPEQIREMNLM